ncbi:MAG: SDR family oxidoreductase [Candidatus Levyibacteriota bacterium]
MKNNVLKKVILITGCSSGFGYFSALRFSRSGYYTFASVRSLKNKGVKKLQRIKQAEKLPLEIFEIDVSKDESVKHGFEFVTKKTKKIDVVINSAGFGSIGPIEEFTIEEIKKQYDTNVFGTLRIIKNVIPLMRKQKSGLIINISSIMGLMTLPLKGVYASSKFAIEAISETLRFELEPFGIKVVLVEPGPFSTNIQLNRRYPQSIHSKKSSYRLLVRRYFQDMQKTDRRMKDKKILPRVNPEKVASLLYQITQKKNPKLRYRIGMDTHIFWIKKFIPNSIWILILRKRYKW